jgi:hypothetical protein
MSGALFLGSSRIRPNLLATREMVSRTGTTTGSVCRAYVDWHGKHTCCVDRVFPCRVYIDFNHHDSRIWVITCSWEAFHMYNSCMWWLPQTSGTHIRESRWFKLMYTLQGKTRPTRHVRFPRQSTYARRTLPVGSPGIWQPFMSHRQSWKESLLPRKRAPDTIHITLADRSTGPYLVSLSSQPLKQWRKSNICQQRATRLTRVISPACNQYVQYFLTRVNPLVLNRHRRGLHPWRCRLSTHHSLTFWTDGPPLST